MVFVSRLIALVGIALCWLGCGDEEGRKSTTPQEIDQAIPAGQTGEVGRNRVTKQEHSLVTKLDSIVIPVVDFKNTTVEEAIDFLRIRSIELAPDYLEPQQKGISFVVGQPKVIAELNDDSQEIGVLGNAPDPSAIMISSYYAENIKLLDVLVDVSKIARLDTYLTSLGIVSVPEGDDPKRHFRKGAEMLKVIWKREGR